PGNRRAFALLGPIRDTPSKRAFGPPLGDAAVTEAARTGVPIVAVGGVGPEHARALRARTASPASAPSWPRRTRPRPLMHFVKSLFNSKNWTVCDSAPTLDTFRRARTLTPNFLSQGRGKRHGINVRRRAVNGNRQGEVVQRCEGIWIHRA